MRRVDTDHVASVIHHSKGDVMKGIIDRFEGDYAVVEFDGRLMVDIPKEQLPTDAKEGDVIVLVDGKYQVDAGETQRRKIEIAKLTENMWE